ncbi:hypothetical protein CQA66_09095, partial [Helicobacter aurati]
FWNNEIIENLEGVVERIKEALNDDFTHPLAPSAQGGGTSSEFSAQGEGIPCQTDSLYCQTEISSCHSEVFYCHSEVFYCHSERSEETLQNTRDVSDVALNMTNRDSCHSEVFYCHSERSEESQQPQFISPSIAETHISHSPSLAEDSRLVPPPCAEGARGWGKSQSKRDVSASPQHDKQDS